MYASRTGISDPHYMADLQLVIGLHNIAREHKYDQEDNFFLRHVAERLQELTNERIKLLDKNSK